MTKCWVAWSEYRTMRLVSEIIGMWGAIFSSTTREYVKECPSTLSNLWAAFRGRNTRSMLMGSVFPESKVTCSVKGVDSSSRVSRKLWYFRPAWVFRRSRVAKLRTGSETEVLLAIVSFSLLVVPESLLSPGKSCKGNIRRTDWPLLGTNVTSDVSNI